MQAKRSDGNGLAPTASRYRGPIAPTNACRHAGPRRQAPRYLPCEEPSIADSASSQIAEPSDHLPRLSMWMVVCSVIVKSPPFHPGKVRPIQLLASSSNLPTVVCSTGSNDRSSYAPRQLWGKPMPGRITVSGGRASSLLIRSPSVMTWSVSAWYRLHRFAAWPCEAIPNRAKQAWHIWQALPRQRWW